MPQHTIQVTEISSIPSIIRTRDRGTVQAEGVPLVEGMMVQVVEVTEMAVLETIEVLLGTGGQTGVQVTPEALVTEEVPMEETAQVAGAAQAAAWAVDRRRTSSCEHLGNQGTMSRPQ